MPGSVEQALLYFVDLRVRVRGIPEARAIVDRCLRILCAARAADPKTLARLEAEIEVLRADLEQRFGRPGPLTVN